MKGKVILLSPVNNRNVRSAALGMAKAQFLANFYSSIAIFPNSLLDQIASVKMFSEIRRRQFDIELKPYIKVWPWLEAYRLLNAKSAIFSKLIGKRVGLVDIDTVSINLDKRVASKLVTAAKNGVKAIYSYEDVASFSFKAAKELSLKCFYDLPIGYWRTAYRILEIERQKLPEWANTLTGFNDSEDKLARKDLELKLADRIFVASTFTAKTLEDYPGQLAPIEFIPYGFPSVLDESQHYNDIVAKRSLPLKILFVGSLSQRKGVSYLFEVVENLKGHVELTVVGNKVVDHCPVLDKALSKCKWIPSLSNNDILTLMRQHHVLVFPSLFEGFGLVITEAMSQGIPVITTDRTAGADFINHNENGWLVTASSTTALQDAVEQLIYHPKMIEDIGRNAMKTASQRTWEHYEREIAIAVSNALN